MDNKQLLILKAYELLERKTPLKTDCGRLCGSLCCKGDKKTGMWLFPGEEIFFMNKNGFTVFDCEGNFGYKAVVCGGGCERKIRPLACRLYPYFPVINKDSFDVRADIRGISSCPLLYENIKPEKAFLRQIRKAARLFSRNEELKHYIINVNNFLDDMVNLAERTASYE